MNEPATLDPYLPRPSAARPRSQMLNTIGDNQTTLQAYNGKMEGGSGLVGGLKSGVKKSLSDSLLGGTKLQYKALMKMIKTEPAEFKALMKGASTTPSMLDSSGGTDKKEALQSTLQGFAAKLGLKSDSSSSTSSSTPSQNTASEWSTPAPLAEFGEERRHRWKRFWDGQLQDAASKPPADNSAARKAAGALAMQWTDLNGLPQRPTTGPETTRPIAQQLSLG